MYQLKENQDSVIYCSISREHGEWPLMCLNGKGVDTGIYFSRTLQEEMCYATHNLFNMLTTMSDIINVQ